jgi:hypothetical protein
MDPDTPDSDAADPQEPSDTDSFLNRRRYLQLGAVSAAGLGLGGARRVSAATTRHGISFSRTVNAVEDLGWDPNGNRNISIPTDNGLLIEVPPGEYVFPGSGGSTGVVQTSLQNWGIRGLGNDPNDVVFRTSNGKSTRFINSYGSSEGILLENVTFDNTMNKRGGDIGSTLRARDNLEVHNVDHIGFSGKEPYCRWSILPTITTSGGVANIVNYRKTGPSWFVGHGSSDGGGGVFQNHKGHINFTNCRIENQGGDGGLYTGKHPGKIVFENCYFANNDMAVIRTGAGSELRNCTIVMDWDNAHPENILDGADDPTGTSGTYFSSAQFGKSGGGIYDCEFILKSTYARGLAGIAINPSDGNMDIHNTRIQNDIDGMAALWAMDPADQRFGSHKTPSRPWGLDIRGLSVTGSSNMRGDAAVFIEGRDGTTIQNSCIEAPNSDGLCIRGASNCSVENTNITAGGRATVFGGSGVSTQGLSYGGSCPLPSLDGGTDAPATEPTPEPEPTPVPDDGADDTGPTAFLDAAPTDGNLIFTSVEELHAVAQQAEAGAEPWASARAEVLSDANAAVDATPVGYTFDNGRAKAEAARDNIRSTALAYALTDDEQYARAAVEHVHAFLVDPETRYPPTEGSMENGYGGKERIINSLVVPGILFGASIVKNHPHWETLGGEQQVQDWCSTYLQTCREYSLQRWGDEDRLYKYSSNRYTYRLSDRMANASYLRDEAEWNDTLRLWNAIHNAELTFDTGANLILDENGAPNGRSRKEGWEYTLFDIDALVACAEIAHHKGVDLYNWQDTPAEADIQFDGHKGTRDGPLLHRMFEWVNNVFYNPDEFEGRLDGGIIPPTVGAEARGLTAYEYASARYDGTLGEEIRAVRNRFMPRPAPNRKYTGFPTLTHGNLRSLNVGTGSGSGSGSGSDGGSGSGSGSGSEATTVSVTGASSVTDVEMRVSAGSVTVNTETLSTGVSRTHQDGRGALVRVAPGETVTISLSEATALKNLSVRRGAVTVALDGQVVDQSSVPELSTASWDVDGAVPPLPDESSAEPDPTPDPNTLSVSGASVVTDVEVRVPSGSVSVDTETLSTGVSRTHQDGRGALVRVAPGETVTMTLSGVNRLNNLSVRRGSVVVAIGGDVVDQSSVSELSTASWDVEGTVPPLPEKSPDEPEPTPDPNTLSVSGASTVTDVEVRVPSGSVSVDTETLSTGVSRTHQDGRGALVRVAPGETVTMTLTDVSRLKNLSVRRDSVIVAIGGDVVDQSSVPELSTASWDVAGAVPPLPDGSSDDSGADSDRPTDTSDAREVRLGGRGYYCRYRITVTEGIYSTEPEEAQPNGARSVTSTLGGYGSDTFLFRGDIISVEFLAGDADVYVDQQLVDPAALGSDDERRTLSIVGRSGLAEYDLTVDGTIEPNPNRGTFDANDSAANGAADGSVGAGGTDSYLFTGEVTSFSLTGDAAVYIDNLQVEPSALGSGADSALPNAIIFDGAGYDGTCEYQFTVDGDVEKSTELGPTEASDRIDGQTVTGSVTAGRDAYRFSGELTDLDVNGSATVRFEIP